MNSNDRNSHAVGAVVAIVLFLVCDLVALGLNVWLSQHIEQQAIVINLAGRQRMLSQRIANSLLRIEKAYAEQREPDLLQQDLLQTYQLFDATLQAFIRGGVTRDATGQSIHLQPLTDSTLRSVLLQANELWQPYHQGLERVVRADGNGLGGLLPTIIRLSEERNVIMLSQMNMLTNLLDGKIRREAARIRTFQSLAFLLALLNVVAAFYLYRRRMLQAQSQSDMLDLIIHRVTASILVLNNQDEIIKANRTAECLFGYPAGSLQGLPLGQLLIHEDKDWHGWHQSGTRFPVEIDRRTLRAGTQQLTIVTVLDITRERQTEQQLSMLAYHDVLTGLPNRLLFDDHLDLEMAHAQRRNKRLAVMFVDLDRFKAVNDSYGHHVGDELLQQVAQRLRQNVTEGDTLSRRGGDEFTLLVCDLENAELAVQIAARIRKQLAQPFLIQNQSLQIGCSVGISLYPDHGQQPQALLDAADSAMYHAKQHGGDGCYLYQPVEPDSSLTLRSA